jgi:hypothetical protein
LDVGIMNIFDALMHPSSGSAGDGDGPTEDDVAAMLSGFDYKAFAAVSKTVVDGYVRVLELGLPPQHIAVAMMYATMNFFRMFGFDDRLPAMLRETANLLEKTGPDKD